MPRITEFANSSAADKLGAPLIEIGWIVAGKSDDADREAVDRVRDHLLAYLQKTFPGFTWRMPVVHREELVRTNREELVVLLDYGIIQRDARHWDFAFIVTHADLISHYKPYALGAPSRAVSVAVMSTARLDPQATPNPTTSEERIWKENQRQPEPIRSGSMCAPPGQVGMTSSVPSCRPNRGVFLSVSPA